MQGHTMTEIVTTAEASPGTVNNKKDTGGFGGGGGGGGGGVIRLYVATTLALFFCRGIHKKLVQSACFFLTHQCNISENKKIKRIQRRNDSKK